MYNIPESFVKSVSGIVKNYLELRLQYFQNSITDQDFVSNNNLINPATRLGSHALPIVVLIGGTGGSGKSTFISYCKHYLEGVSEESTIDPCKDIVNFMINMEHIYEDCGTLKNDIKEKNNIYRSLLADLKQAWLKADDGPNEILLGKLKHILNGDYFEEDYSLIFVNVREPDQFVHLKKRLEEELGCIVLTLCILRNDPDIFENDADRNTLHYDYDLVFNNSYNLDVVENYARAFTTAICEANVKVKEPLNN